MGLWGWLDKAKQFIQTFTDKVIGKEAEKQLVAAVISQNIGLAKIANDGLISGKMTLGVWETAIRQQLKTEYIQQYLLGIGGARNITQKDYGSIGGMLREQYRYLNGFAHEIADGKLTPAQIENRLNMYFNSARESFERGRARSWGIPDGKIPFYPGSGSTKCLTNCTCGLDIIPVSEGNNLVGWNVFWQLGIAEHCDDCLDLASKWNPLFISI